MHKKISFLILTLFFVVNLHSTDFTREDKIDELTNLIMNHPDNDSITPKIKALSAYINEYDEKDGITSLHYAAIKKSFHTTKALLELGSRHINHQTKHASKTPLHLAVAQNDCNNAPSKKLVQLLLDHEADLTLLDTGYFAPIPRLTPAQTARKSGYHEIAEILETEPARRARWNGLRSAWVAGAVRTARSFDKFE